MRYALLGSLAALLGACTVHSTSTTRSSEPDYAAQRPASESSGDEVGASQGELEQAEGSSDSEHPRGGPPGQTGEHPRGGPPGQTGEHPQGGPPGQAKKKAGSPRNSGTARGTSRSTPGSSGNARGNSDGDHDRGHGNEADGEDEDNPGRGRGRGKRK
jgi:hypothetical protein